MTTNLQALAATIRDLKTVKANPGMIDMLIQAREEEFDAIYESEREVTLWATDGMSMTNMNQRVRLFTGRMSSAMTKLEYYQEHKELGYYGLEIQ